MSSNLVRYPCYKYLHSASTTQRIKSQFKQPFVRDEKDCAPYHFPRQDWCKPWPKCCQPLRLYDGGYCISDACVHLPGGFFSCLVPIKIRMRHHNSAHREIRAKVLAGRVHADSLCRTTISGRIQACAQIPGLPRNVQTQCSRTPKQLPFF